MDFKTTRCVYLTRCWPGTPCAVTHEFLHLTLLAGWEGPPAWPWVCASTGSEAGLFA